MWFRKKKNEARIISGFGEPFEELPFNDVQRNDFLSEDTKTIICKCGNDKFLISNQCYMVMIKCPICNYEICIADG